MTMQKPAFIFILVFLWIALPAQDRPDRNSSVEQDTLAKEDFGLFNDGNKNTFKVLFSGKPGRAAFYSLVLPGAGQIYNRRYWKLPIVYGALAGVGYLLYTADSTYQGRKQEYIENINGSSADVNTNYSYYIQAKKSRESAIFTVIGVHLFNVFDAYIDRHLIDFDTDEDISFRIKAFPDGISPIGLSFCYTFDSPRAMIYKGSLN